MFLDVVGRTLSTPPSFGFGPGDWTALGITLALFAAAFVVPALIENRASRSRVPRPGPVQPRPTGTLA